MSVPVVMLADLSASMAFVGRQRRADVLADFTESLAWAAYKTGDSFSFIGADAGLPTAWWLPATRQRGAGIGLGRRLRGHAFDGPGRDSAEGLRDAHRLLPRRRCLVFLVSDFHWPADQLDAVLDSLVGHEVVPVVLWDRSEFELPERHGLAWLEDAETRQRRLLWLRPALAQRWSGRLAQAKVALTQQVQRRRWRPLFLVDGFDANAVTAHFHG